ncbi:TlpA disulfide reductase family protein [Lacinutrix neustonica]|uniref:TlpA disulfide reductase family protein n=1 Tax=Lacinutrix neustonica TaxID=2980107 RepID=A0A9E8MZZ7_9FLAO|nr:TlpA disulfide reductase family protein [Lacinutrix neustonica]WAC03360.1 TlpA disulfide reductase family protein [Lacinutrix neustonica]
MKHTLIGLILIASIFSCKTEEKEQPLVLGDFEMSQETIVHNQPISITYNGNDKNMEAFYYQLKGYKAYPVDLNFENSTATIVIPDSITAVAFNFKVDGTYLNNDKKGYLFAVQDQEGIPVAGSQSSLEYYKTSYGEQYGLEGDNAIFVSTLIKEVNENAKVKEVWEDQYLNLILRNDREKGETIANKLAQEISSKKVLTEADYNQLHSIYSMTRKSNLADSLAAIATEKFPKGKIKKQILMNQFYDAKTLEEKEVVFNELHTNFDMEPSLSYAASNMASEHFKAGDMEAFKQYADKIESPSDKAGMYNSVAWPLAEKGEHLETAAEISKASLELMKAQQNSTEGKPEYYSEKQHKKNLQRSYNMYADTYALIQYKLGNTKEAITYQAQAIGDGLNTEINERYIEFLVADKQYERANEKANVFLNAGHGTEKMTALYRKSYAQAHPNATDFDAIIANIEQKSRNKALDNLKKEMLDDAAPAFELKNLDGKTVSLESLKGKTVILDLRATWCGPCKASFPGMQQVVEKYEGDENVVILFVDTFEDGANREQDVAQFITDNKYDFHVLIDGKIKDSDKYEVANKYGISGIPTKIVIGPNGRIKFKSVGFSGSNDKLKQEMDLMIDLVKS